MRGGPTRERAIFTRRILVGGALSVVLGCGPSPQTSPDTTAEPNGSAANERAEPESEPPALKGPAPVARNLLLVSIDTLRADRVGVLGGGEWTPRLDAFAEGGFVLEAASSPSPWTLPAHASLLTGLYPSHHGALRTGSDLAEHVDPLSAQLVRRGFETAAIVNSWLLARTGLERGFETLRYLREEVAQRAPAPIVEETRAWLEARGDERPFFLFVHSYDVHSDYVSEAEYEGDLRGDYTGPIDGSTGQLEELRAGELPVDRDDLRQVELLYDAGVRQFDDVFGDLIDLFEERGLLASTLVVVTSDHGEEFFEHGGVLHGQTQFEEVVRVPLILRGPGIPAGARSSVPVSLVDVVPTVLGRLGVPAGPDLDGLDLAPLWSSARTPIDTRYLFFEADHRGDGGGGMRAVRDDRFKLHLDLSDGSTRLYDLITDPGEAHNVSEFHPERAGRLERVLREHLESGVERESPEALGDVDD